MSADGRRGLVVLRVSLLVVAVLLLGMVANLALVSRLTHTSAQHHLFDKFRAELADATGPVGQANGKGRLVPLGSPVAMIKIPALGLSQVVVEGTTSATLMLGPGHRRDTPLPGQAGSSYLLARAYAYGAPFGHIQDLHRGDRILTTTSEGRATYRVIDVRYPGAPDPPALKATAGRLTLVTATGSYLVPSGVVYVDADLVSKTLPGGPQYPGPVPANERALTADTSTIWALVLWMEALVLASIGAAWSWVRWGRPQAWVVFVPVLSLVGYFTCQQATLLLPNLL